MKRILILSRFLETSAKTNINVEQAFVQLAESILEKTNVQAACHTLPLHNTCVFCHSKSFANNLYKSVTVLYHPLAMAL
jgi:hypothetical protein